MILKSILGNPESPIEKLDPALKSVEAIAQCSGEKIAQESYCLFHMIMGVNVSNLQHYNSEKKWTASRFAMQGAYKHKIPPPAKELKNIITFLDYHLIHGDQFDESIQNALQVLTLHNDDKSIQDALQALTSRGLQNISSIFQESKPIQLREVALLFLPVIGKRLFNDDPLEANEKESLCALWAHTISAIKCTDNIQVAILDVFFQIIGSTNWQPHIVSWVWKPLEFIASIEDPKHLRRCLDNTDFMALIKDGEDMDAKLHWLGILGLKYESVVPEAQEKLGISNNKEQVHKC